MTAVGIDFGTTNSALATFTGGTATAVDIDIRDDEWKALGFGRVMPSVFARGDAGEPLFGWAAKLRPGRNLAAVKRLLAADDKVELDGEEYYVEEVASLLFGAIKQGAASQGLDVRKAVVTVPSNSRGLARLRTRICAQMAGIEVPILINEPTAAAMAYGLRTTTDQNVLVVDWGGGTLDVTLLQVSAGVFVEQASKGVQHLGGIDVDRLIFLELTRTVSGSDSWSEAEHGAAMLEIEKAKIRLSDHEETRVALPRGQDRDLSRRQLNEIVAPLIERLLVPVRTVVAEGEESGSPVDSILLVGGSCKMPIIREKLAELIGREPARSTVDPMTAVAEGAAIAAAILDGEYDADFFVTTEHALGTAVLDPATGVRSFSTILQRNTKLPAKGSEFFSPVVDDQDSLNLSVWEGDEDKALTDADNVLLGEFRVALTPRPLSEARLHVEYSYDVNGLLNVTLTDDVDQSVRFQGPVQSAVSRDPRALVEMAQSVEATLAQAPGQAAVAAPVLPPDVVESLGRARAKVIPFVPNEEGESIRQLADALEVAATSGDGAAAKAALDEVLRKYAYLY